MTVEQMALSAAKGAVQQMKRAEAQQVKRDWLRLVQTRYFRFDEQKSRMVEIVRLRGWKQP